MPVTTLLSASIKPEIGYQYIGFIASLRMPATQRRKSTIKGYLPRIVLPFVVSSVSIETLKHYEDMSSS